MRSDPFRLAEQSVPSSPEMTAADGIVDEMRELVRLAAYPEEPGETVKGSIRRASRRLRISFTQARRLWYGNRAAIMAHEADEIRRRAAVVLLEVEAAADRKLEMVRAKRAALQQREDRCAV